MAHKYDTHTFVLCDLDLHKCVDKGIAVVEERRKKTLEKTVQTNTNDVLNKKRPVKH